MKKEWGGKPAEYMFLASAGIILMAILFFAVAKPDHMMHSDTAAEVILSKLLSEENRLVTGSWYYSTEIRIVYSQLIMAPLFKLFDSFRLVKLLSNVVFYILMLAALRFAAGRFGISRRWTFVGVLLLFTPLSKEYLDMMLVGCFYSSQTVCTYLVLGIAAGWYALRERKRWQQAASLLLAHLFAFVLGLSGLRYLASLFLPMCAAALWVLLTEEGELFQGRLLKNKSFVHFVKTVTLLLCAGGGLLVNQRVLSVRYSFDRTPVTFVELSQVPERFLASVRLMIEFFGYYPVGAVSGRGAVNAVKCALLCFFVLALATLFRVRKEKLSRLQRFLLYDFIAALAINWYMLVFTDVLQQYRYWIPVYILAVLLLAVFFQVFAPGVAWRRDFYAACVCLAALSSLYGELWQDAKYNDCEMRYGYMAFLEENGYTFGYATFWNGPVTEYLSNGTIEVGNLGGQDGIAAPYEWLSKKALYREGYHTGKTFLLLARTEEAGMLKGDFTVMPDGVKVYEDAYYVIYEGNGMYLFSDDAD